MESSFTNNIARSIRSSVLATIFGFGALRLLGSSSDEWRVAGMALGIISAMLILAAMASLLGLLAELIAIGISFSVTRSMSLFRFHAFRKLVAMMVGSLISIVGFAAVSSYDPMWAAIPAVLGFLVMKIPGGWSILVEQSWFYRMFRSGNAPEAEFAQAYHLKQVAKPFRSTFRVDGGFCSDSLFIGTSTRESS